MSHLSWIDLLSFAFWVICKSIGLSFSTIMLVCVCVCVCVWSLFIPSLLLLLLLPFHSSWIFLHQRWPVFFFFLLESAWQHFQVSRTRLSILVALCNVVAWMLYYYYHYLLIRVFHISVCWLYFTRDWVTVSLLKSPGLFSVFCPSSIMLLLGWSPLGRQLPNPPGHLIILSLPSQKHQSQLV